MLENRMPIKLDGGISLPDETVTKVKDPNEHQDQRAETDCDAVKSLANRFISVLDGGCCCFTSHRPADLKMYAEKSKFIQVLDLQFPKCNYCLIEHLRQSLDLRYSPECGWVQLGNSAITLRKSRRNDDRLMSMETFLAHQPFENENKRRRPIELWHETAGVRLNGERLDVREAEWGWERCQQVAINRALATSHSRPRGNQVRRGGLRAGEVIGAERCEKESGHSLLRLAFQVAARLRSILPHASCVRLLSSITEALPKFAHCHLSPSQDNGTGFHLERIVNNIV